jgi:hypothetical protein
VPNGGVRKVGYTGIVVIEMCGEQGAYSSEPQGTTRALQRSMVNSSSDETSVGMYNLENQLLEYIPLIVIQSLLYQMVNHSG